MILQGTNITTEYSESVNTAALTVSQLIRFNAVKKKKSLATTNNRSTYETPLPVYLSLMLRVKTRKKSIINQLFRFSPGISYNRVCSIETGITNQLCNRCVQNKVACPPVLENSVFTTSAIDNIDHNATSSTAESHFHGTGISLFQHPDESIKEHLFEYDFSTKNYDQTELSLPDYYTYISPILDGKAEFPILLTNTSDKSDFKWNSRRSSWRNAVLTFNALLPLLRDNINSPAVVKHTIDIIGKTLKHLNPGQTPLVTAGQPVYAIAKQQQWKLPNSIGENKVIIMMGALHGLVQHVRLVKRE